MDYKTGMTDRGGGCSDALLQKPGSFERRETVQAFCGSEISIVADLSPGEENVFKSRASADVMDNVISLTIARSQVDDEADVRQPAAQVPRHDVARLVTFCIRGDRQRFVAALEVSHQVR